MASIPGLSEAAIRSHSAPESFGRGQSYYRSGAVADVALRGDTLQGHVEGSEYAPYRVNISFDRGGITAATCTCPYDWGGWCKHIVAVLLACLYDGDEIEARPALGELLAGLDRAQLQALLVGLAERDPELADAIERQVALLQLANAAPPQRQTGAGARRSPIDQDSIRRQVSALMRPSQRGRYRDYDDYDYDDEDPGGDIVEGVRPLLERVRQFLAGGDGRSALDILEALTTEYIEGCHELGDRFEEMYGIGIAETSVGEFFDDLAAALAEAVLSADLADGEREDWAEKIAGWNDDADDLGAGQAFDIALTAAEQGWSYPPLRRALAGEIDESGAWEGEPPDYADELATIRLRILDRQGRHQEYLYLAEAEGQVELYVLMLARLGRTDEAMAEGLKYLAMPKDALELAKALRERDDLEGAVRIAEHGLALPAPQPPTMYGADPNHQKAPLADWLADLAASMGDGERALRAAETAFRAAPSLEAYRKAQGLAGERWDAARPALLKHLRQTKEYVGDAKVDIFLHEGLIDDAIAAVQDRNYYGPALARVMDAALATRPDWVIKAATKQAEAIMDAGKAQHYDAAADWLRRARDAYKAAGRADDWRGYIGSVRAKHGRKYKLMGLIERL